MWTEKAWAATKCLYPKEIQNEVDELRAELARVTAERDASMLACNELLKQAVVQYNPFLFVIPRAFEQAVRLSKKAIDLAAKKEVEL